MFNLFSLYLVTCDLCSLCQIKHQIPTKGASQNRYHKTITIYLCYQNKEIQIKNPLIVELSLILFSIFSDFFIFFRCQVSTCWLTMTTSQYLNILTVTWGPTSPPELDQENVRCVYFIIFNPFVLTASDPQIKSSDLKNQGKSKVNCYFTYLWKHGGLSLYSSLSAPLSVQSVDMCLQINKSNHITSAYNNQNLVVRRGLEFIMKVTFNRPLTQGDDFQVEFLIGEFWFSYSIVR